MEKNGKHVVQENVVEKTLSLAEDAIENAKEKGNEVWDKTKEMGEDILSGVQADGEKAWKKTKSFIQKHPFQTIGYSLLLGAVVGAFLNSKRQD